MKTLKRKETNPPSHNFKCLFRTNPLVCRKLWPTSTIHPGIFRGSVLFKQLDCFCRGTLGWYNCSNIPADLIFTDDCYPSLDGHYGLYPASRVSFDLPRKIGKRKETLLVACTFFDPPIIQKKDESAQFRTGRTNLPLLRRLNRRNCWLFSRPWHIV